MTLPSWQREEDSPHPQPCCYSSYNKLFHAPWSDRFACTTENMSWRTRLVVYKQMQSNPIISFQSQSFKAVDFSQLLCSDVLFTQTQRNFSIQISPHKNRNAIWVRIASIWKEAVLLLHWLKLKDTIAEVSRLCHLSGYYTTGLTSSIEQTSYSQIMPFCFLSTNSQYHTVVLISRTTPVKTDFRTIVDFILDTGYYLLRY